MFREKSILKAIGAAIGTDCGGPILDGTCSAIHEIGRRAGTALLRVRQNRRQKRRLPLRQVCGRDSKVMPRARLCPKHTRGEFRNIEVNLYHSALGPDQLHNRGDHRLHPFAKPRPPMPQKRVLDGLLTDRGAPARGTGVDRSTDRGHVEPPMQAEIRILCRYNRPGQHRRDLFD